MSGADLNITVRLRLWDIARTGGHLGTTNPAAIVVGPLCNPPLTAWPDAFEYGWFQSRVWDRVNCLRWGGRYPDGINMLESGGRGSFP